jgi:hypothetical protein
MHAQAHPNCSAASPGEEPFMKPLSAAVVAAQPPDRATPVPGAFEDERGGQAGGTQGSER